MIFLLGLKGKINAQLIPQLVIIMRITSTTRSAAEITITCIINTRIYVENLLKVKSKNHRTNRSTPSFHCDQQRVQGVFSGTSWVLHQQQHTNQQQVQTSINCNQPVTIGFYCNHNQNREVTDSIPLGNQFISHKIQLHYARNLVGKYIHKSPNHWPKISSIGHRLTTWTNHPPNLLYSETAVTRTDNAPLKSDDLHNQSSN